MLNFSVKKEEIETTEAILKKSDFRMTLKNGFDKCSLFVLSANGWKDQNMTSSFSCKRKPWYGEGIVRLANRVEVWRQTEVSIDF